MRLLLAVALVLLFLWLRQAQTSGGASHGQACEAVSMSQAAVSVLLSPLSLYSWTASTLLRLVLSVPALVLSSFHYSLLLLLAGPWCAATVCISVLLTCLHVALYLLHLALVLGVVAILTLVWPNMADSDTPSEEVGERRTKTRRRMFGCGAVQQG